MENYNNFNNIVNQLKKEFSNFRLIEKENSFLMKFIYYFGFMFLWNKNFLTNFTTSILFRIYMPKNFIGTLEGIIILRHERIHIRDCWKTGILPFIFSYLFILPAGLSLRAYWEYRAYKESLKAYYEMQGHIPNEIIENFAKEFSSSTYLWMFPFPKFIKNKFLNYIKEIKLFNS